MLEHTSISVRRTISRVVICLIVVAIGIVGKCSTAADEVNVTRGVTYAERDGVVLKADWYVPKKAGTYPGVVMIHGGAWRYGDRWQVFRHANVVAQGGYSVMAISYRLAPEHKFPAQIDDCESAVRWMRTHAKDYQVDAKRIATYGYSAGAHLACLVGLSPHEAPVQAVVAGGTPCDFDFVRTDGQIMSYLFGGSPREKPDLYYRATPRNFVTADDPPVFFFHGENDELVPRSSPEKMKDLLSKAGVKTEFVYVPKAGHIGAFLDEKIPGRAREFLDATLKEKSQASAE